MFSRKVLTQHPWIEIPEIISAEQHCFRFLTFFSADSEKMKKINDDQLCLELKNSALSLRKSALNQCFSAMLSADCLNYEA